MLPTFTGGNDGSDLTDIIQFDINNEKWIQTGFISNKNTHHAVSTISHSNLQDLCRDSSFEVPPG